MLEDLRTRISASSAGVLANPERLFSLVLDLYERERIDGANLEDDGDMLLFQWGQHDWGQGLQFELDLTRQAILSAQDDPSISQLHATYRYDPAEFDGIASGKSWCHNPSELDQFRRLVLSSEAIRRAVGRRHTSFELRLEDAE